MLKWLKDKAGLARALSLPDWLTLAEAWWTLVVFYVAVRTISFDRLNRSRQVVIASNITDKLDDARNLHRLVHLASRLHLLSMTCLPRALTLRRILVRHGISAQLQIGVRKTSQGMTAHAWVGVNGQQIGEPEEVLELFQKFDLPKTKKIAGICAGGWHPQ